MSVDSRERFNLFCCWCSKKDFDTNLDPAGTYQATKLTTKSNHVKDLTAKRREMVTKLNHKPVSRLLGNGDIANNKRFYHDKCYGIIRYHYSKITKSESDKSSSMCDTECKQIALKKVILYLQDSEMCNSGNFYRVMELETMYSDLLKSAIFIIITILLLSLTYWKTMYPVQIRKQQISVLAYFLTLRQFG